MTLVQILQRKNSLGSILEVKSCVHQPGLQEALGITFLLIYLKIQMQLRYQMLT